MSTVTFSSCDILSTEYIKSRHSHCMERGLRPSKGLEFAQVTQQAEFLLSSVLLSLDGILLHGYTSICLSIRLLVHI